MNRHYLLLAAMLSILLTLSCSKGGDSDIIGALEFKLNVSPSTLSVGSDGGSATVAVDSNVRWALSSDTDWCHVSNSSGTGNATVTITVDDNRSLSSRKATLTFRATTAEASSLTRTVEVTQAAPTFTVTPTAVTLASSGAKGEFVISGNSDWTASSGAGWCHIDKESGSGTTTITVTADDNTSLSDRSTVITVKSGDKVHEVKVTQNFTDFTVTPATLEFPAKNASGTITLTGISPWQARSSVSWCRIDKESGSGTTTITVTADDNTTLSTREATINITADVKEYRVIVTQLAGSFSVTPEAVTVPAANASATFSINGNVPWTVNSSDGWCRPDQSSGIGEAVINLEIGDNTDVAQRMAKVTVTADGNPYIVTVTQNAGERPTLDNPEAMPDASDPKHGATASASCSSVFDIESCGALISSMGDPGDELNRPHSVEGTCTGGKITVQITGLMSGTKYYIRLFADNAVGRSLSRVTEITTDGSRPGENDNPTPSN